jgi:hypothetical protein
MAWARFASAHRFFRETSVQSEQSHLSDGRYLGEGIGCHRVSDRYEAGKMVLGEPKGVCRSETGGLLYKCELVPFKNAGTGRYASSPSNQVGYACYAVCCMA